MALFDPILLSSSADSSGISDTDRVSVEIHEENIYDSAWRRECGSLDSVEISVECVDFRGFGVGSLPFSEEEDESDSSEVSVELVEIAENCTSNPSQGTEKTEPENYERIWRHALRSNCKACVHMKAQNKRQDLLHVQPLLEVLYRQKWGEVESIKRIGTTYMVRCKELNQEVEVDKELIRLRSRKALDSDCQNLQEGVDVCVFAVHPRSKTKAYHDAQICKVQRKTHQYGYNCNCSFSVYMYNIGDTVTNGEMELIKDHRETFTINRIKILQAPLNMTMEDILEAAINPGNVRRRWSRDIGSIQGNQDLLMHHHRRQQSGHRYKTKNGYNKYYDLVSDSSEYSDSEDSDMAEFLSFLDTHLEPEVVPDSEEDNKVVPDSEDGGQNTRIYMMKKPRKKRKDAGMQRNRSSTLTDGVYKRHKISDGVHRRYRRYMDMDPLNPDKYKQKHKKRKRKKYESQARRQLFNTNINTFTKVKKLVKPTIQHQQNKRAEAEGVAVGEETTDGHRKRSKPVQKGWEGVHVESDEEDLEVEQGFIVSLDEYWRGRAAALEAEFKSEEEVRLARIIAEMEMDRDKYLFPAHQTGQKDKKRRFKKTCEEHDYVMDDQYGLVCCECGHVGLHVNRMAARPQERDANYKLQQGQNDPDNDLSEGFINPQDEACDLFVTNKQVLKKMHPHQKRAVAFMKRNIIDEQGGCILAHAPGTGKTFTTIAFFGRYREQNPHCRLLILAPKAVLKYWRREFQKWNVETPFQMICSGDLTAKRSESLAKWQRRKGVLIMTYALFVKIGMEGRMTDLRKYVLELPDLLVLDEGHLLRSKTTNLWQTLMKVRTKLRIMLSGSLFQNNFDELFNLIYLVRPSFVKQLEDYKLFELYNNDSSEVDHEKLEGLARKWFNHEIGRKFNQGNDGLEDAREKLITMTRSFTDHYKGEILNSLPGLCDYEVTLRLTDVQVDLLEKTMKILNGIEAELVNTYVCIHPYLLTCCGSFKCKIIEVAEQVENLSMDIQCSMKMKFVLKILELCRYTSEKVIVFSEQIAPLDLLTRLTGAMFGWAKDKEVLQLSGDLLPSQRQDLIDKFNLETHPSRVCLASIRSCAEGITLTGASRVIFLHSVWNASLMNQAISRAFRLGQTRKVFVYRLVTNNLAEQRKNGRTVWKDWVSVNIFAESDKHVKDGNGAPAGGGNKGLEIFEEDKMLAKVKEQESHGIIKVEHRTQPQEDNGEGNGEGLQDELEIIQNDDYVSDSEGD